MVRQSLDGVSKGAVEGSGRLSRAVVAFWSVECPSNRAVISRLRTVSIGGYCFYWQRFLGILSGGFARAMAFVTRYASY